MTAPPQASDRLLAQATRCLTADDLPGALDALLRGWRAGRHAAMATRIQRLGEFLGPCLPAIVGDNPSHRHERWLERAAEARPVDQWRLRQGFADDPMTRIHQRLRWLAGQPPDPRWTPIVAEIAVAHALDYWPDLAPSPSRIWRTCVDVLTELGDPQAAAYLEAEYDASLEENDPAEERGWAAYTARVRMLMTALESHVPKETPTPTVLEAFDAAFTARQTRPPPTAARLSRSRSADRDADMLALIYAEPDDVDVRRVYADWLEVTGAPRAELMRLQLQQRDTSKPSKAAERRITRLTDRHGMRWLGKLAPYVRNVDWHLGFPAGGDIAFRGQAQRDEALALDAWRTFTEVHVRDPDVLTHPNLANVRKIGRSAPFESSQQRLTPVSAEVVEGASRPTACGHAVIEGAAAASIIHRDWSALETIEVVLGEGPFEAAALPSCDTLIFWHIETADIFRMVRMFGPAGCRCFSDGSGFRYRLYMNGGPNTLDIFWTPTRACEDFTPTLAVAQGLAPISGRIFTPGYAQPAAFLSAWQAALAPTPFEMPRARRGRSKPR